jgi:UDPglucose 6-dehydrogenase
MNAAREPIAVIGTGYVGLVTAAGFAELGSEVWCVDIDVAKIERLKAGEVPIYEPGLKELLERNGERLHFSTELSGALDHARLLFVAVGTPPTYSGDADLSAVHAVVDAIPASDRHALVMKSTVPCGTGAALQRVLKERGRDGLQYVSCPEFLKEGSAVKDFLHPDRVVVGDDGGWAGDAVVELYAPLDAPLVRTDVASAEMVKLASNAFLATKISFINEIANVCEETGADVVEVARGMGLDDRIGSKFLQAGIGFGGSCFAPDETVLARRYGRTTLLTFAQLWEQVQELSTRVEGPDLLAYGTGSSTEVIEPSHLEVLSWVRDEEEARFLPVLALSRRPYDGEMIEVRTKMGRRVRTTPDHPWVVGDGRSSESEVKLAFELTERDWVPIAGRRPNEPGLALGTRLPVDRAIEAARLEASAVIVRPPGDVVQELVSPPMVERRRVFAHRRGAAARTGDVKRSGAVRLDELQRAECDWTAAKLGTARNGTYIPGEIPLDRELWRVVGLYLAEGHTHVEANGTTRIAWSFHPSREEHLVAEVLAFWRKHGVKARAHHETTARCVTVSSRLLGGFWNGMLGLGRNSYEQRLPDLIWDADDEARWALLSGLWEGDGAWSLVNGGPSAVLEFGTVSDELADGVLRLLGDLDLIASHSVRRVHNSTKDTHWIRISGADQLERGIALVPERDRLGVMSTLATQRKRIAPTGFRRLDADGIAWARITELRPDQHVGHVYSIEVPLSHTVVTSTGLTTSNCFPKDVDALKQLAGNSGYHFQLLNAVIQVNDLQKRRVIGKLQRHLGQLAGKRVALLGLAFKPNTDDMREASSLVLAARLQADGAQIAAFDPVAEEAARALMGAVEFADDPLAAVRDADAVVLVTEWPQLLELDWAQVADAMRGNLVVDGRNALDPAAVRAAGLLYAGVGRG